MEQSQQLNTRNKISATSLEKNSSNYNTHSQIYYTRKEVATLLSCSLSTVYNWTTRGILTSYGIGNKILYRVDEVHNSLIKL
jgi:excisionase family DNA binding protein